MSNDDERDYAEEAANDRLLREIEDCDDDYCGGHPMTWDKAYELFDDHLNQLEEDRSGRPGIMVMGYSFDFHETLRELDPIAYREEFNGWADAVGIETGDLIGPDKMSDD